MWAARQPHPAGGWANVAGPRGALALVAARAAGALLAQCCTPPAREAPRARAYLASSGEDRWARIIAYPLGRRSSEAWLTASTSGAPGAVAIRKTIAGRGQSERRSFRPVRGGARAESGAS